MKGGGKYKEGKVGLTAAGWIAREKPREPYRAAAALMKSISDGCLEGKIKRTSPYAGIHHLAAIVETTARGQVPLSTWSPS